MLIFSNPYGLWALLALPAIILIHCLQERSRRLRTTTLFLLERVAPESVGGATFERLRNSLPLWLQLLAVILIAWMLAGPRWVRKDSRQSVVVVLDSSVSMSAFKEQTRAALVSTLNQWSKNTAKTEWHLLESDANKPTLYAGEALPLLLSAYDHWQPSKGTHSPQDALGIARGLVRDGSGLVIFVTDHKAEVASEVALLSAAQALDNVGFAGIDVTLTEGSDAAHRGLKWRALAKNYSSTSQTREWWVETQVKDKDNTPQRARIDIAPGTALAISGELPPDVERATIRMSSDRFVVDDSLPILKPTERLLRVANSVAGPSGELLKKMIAAEPAVTFVAANEAPDVTLATIGSNAPTDAIYIDTPAPEGTKLDSTFVVAENHPLVRELNWMGLITSKPPSSLALPSDSVLLWKGDTALAFLRRTNVARAASPSPSANVATSVDEQLHEVRQLFLDWDLSKSNANRQPAVLVLLHRFLDETRRELDGERSANYEAGERIVMPSKMAQSTMQLLRDGKSEAFTGRAPEQPGYFEVLREGKAFIHGAAHFADAREADFSACTEVDTTVARRLELAMRESEADPLTPLWALLVLGCLLGAWGATR